MTVREMIARMSAMDQDAEVFVVVNDDYGHWIEPDIEVHEHNGQVVIG